MIPAFGQAGVSVGLRGGLVGHADLRDVVRDGVGLPVAAAGHAMTSVRLQLTELGAVPQSAAEK
jgi:hypothetical protein